MQNGTDAVSVSGNGGQAQFSTGPYNGDMNAYISAVVRAVAGTNSISLSAIPRTTVNGIPASHSTARENSKAGQGDRESDVRGNSVNLRVDQVGGPSV